MLAVGKQRITCAPTELVTIEPPTGLSCSAYMNPYIAFASGYLADPSAITACALCPFRTTDAYVQFRLNVSYGHHWMDLGVVLRVTAFNVRLFLLPFLSSRALNWADVR